MGRGTPFRRPTAFRLQRSGPSGVGRPTAPSARPPSAKIARPARRSDKRSPTKASTCAWVARQMGSARASASWPRSVSDSRRLRRSRGSASTRTRPRRCSHGRARKVCTSQKSRAIIFVLLDFALPHQWCEAKRSKYAPVAQLDRVLGYEPRGRGFESCRARQFAGSGPRQASWAAFSLPGASCRGWCPRLPPKRAASSPRANPRTHHHIHRQELARRLPCPYACRHRA